VTVAQLLDDPQQRNGLLNALDDVALDAPIPAVVFAVAANALEIPWPAR